MKKVFMLVAVATFALTGIVSAEKMAAQDKIVPEQAVEAAVPAVEAAAPAVEAAAPVAAQVAPVAVGNTVCPVCGMEIPADMLGKNMVEFNGKIVNVCSADDRAKFVAEPDKYLKIAEDSVPKAAPADAKAAQDVPTVDAAAMPETK